MLYKCFVFAEDGPAMQYAYYIALSNDSGHIPLIQPSQHKVLAHHWFYIAAVTALNQRSAELSHVISLEATSVRVEKTTSDTPVNLERFGGPILRQRVVCQLCKCLMTFSSSISLSGINALL